MTGNTQTIQKHSPLLIMAVVSATIAGLPLAAEEINWSKVNASIGKAYPSVSHISTTALAEWLADESKRRPLLLDVRAEAEYKVSHLKDAKWTPSEALARKHLKGMDKHHPIVLYCSVGYRSAALAEKLEKLGYANVLNLFGSIFQWRNEGRPVYANGKSVATVHPYDEKWGSLLKPEYRAEK